MDNLLEKYIKYHISNIDKHLIYAVEDEELRDNYTHKDLKKSLLIILNRENGIDNLDGWAKDVGILNYSEFITLRREKSINEILK